MAGSLYLGSQKVCPAISLGEPEPVEYTTLLKIPDDVTSISTGTGWDAYRYFNYATNPEQNPTLPAPQKVLIDLNNLEEVNGGVFSQSFACLDYSQFSFRAPKLKRMLGGYTFQFWFYNFLRERDTPLFYESEIDFPDLEEIETEGLRAFVLPGISDVFFRKLRTIGDEYVFTQFLVGASGPVTLHFPLGVKSAIEQQADYPSFSCNYSVTILYDQ